MAFFTSNYKNKSTGHSPCCHVYFELKTMIRPTLINTIDISNSRNIREQWNISKSITYNHNSEVYTARMSKHSAVLTLSVLTYIPYFMTFGSACVYVAPWCHLSLWKNGNIYIYCSQRRSLHSNIILSYFRKVMNPQSKRVDDMKHLPS
jgi:hypothetical protein